MTRKIRWGILSTSNHAAKRVIPAIHASADGEAAAVASRNLEPAQRYAASLTIPKAYGTYEALLDDPEIDALYIPLPNHLHKEWSIRAAQAGKHVLCEKPIGLNAEEAEGMVRVFREANLKLAEAFQWRHHPQAQRVRQMVKDGVIGDLRLIDAGFSFYMDVSENVRWQSDMGGGALYDVGCYPIALTRYITGQEPIAVTAQGRWGETAVDELVVATLEYPDGVLAHINCAFIIPLRRYYEVCGTEGVLKVEYAYNPIGDRPNKILQYGPDYTLTGTVDVGTIDSYTLMIQEFNTAILQDRDPAFPAEDAVKNMRVIDAIFKAMREERRVVVSG